MFIYQCNKHNPVINSNLFNNEMPAVEAEDNKKSGY